MSEAVEGLVRAIPPDMEREKATLVLAMVLTKKIVNTVPSLLPRVFRTTVNYINQQLHNYIVRMVSAVKRLGASHSWALSWPKLFLEGWPSSEPPVAAGFPVVLRRFGQKGMPVPVEFRSLMC